MPGSRPFYIFNLVASLVVFGCGSSSRKAGGGVQNKPQPQTGVDRPAQEAKGLNPAAPSKPAPRLEPAQVGPAIAQFGRRLYLSQSAHSRPDENLVISPWSVYQALAVVRGGASGQTAVQLNQVLGVPPQADAHGSMSAIGRVTGSALDAAYNAWVNGDEPATFGIADGLLIDDAFEFNPEFAERNRMTMSVNLIGKGFERQTEVSRLQINQWVKEGTDGVISNILGPGALSPVTRFIVVSAIRFRGGWAYPFNRQFTKARPFWGRGQAKKLVPTMHIVSDFRVYEARGLGYRAVDLPYDPKLTSMTIILPDEGTDIRALESKLDFASVARALDKSPARTTMLTLPRFQAEAGQAMSLTHSLRKLGVSDAFDPKKADFSSMTKSRQGPLAMDDVVHKAVVGVSEEGVVGVAAAPGSINSGSAAKDVYEFRINRPFLFFVREKKSQALFFIGRVVDPKTPSRRQRRK